MFFYEFVKGIKLKKKKKQDLNKNKKTIYYLKILKSILSTLVKGKK
jgi:hypothetical protein